MSGFADLPEKAQPCLGKYPAKATAGASWEFVAAGPDFYDADDEAVDFTDTTGVCVLVDADGNELATFDYEGRVGEVVVSLEESETATLGSGPERRCRWSLAISDGTDTVQVWARAESPFIIRES
ncbi:hypothetical protein [Nocardioides sp. AX2bis]|uniref:hypothetical protein n=1 Tax=Nocardioides sp. AX2bis TaxID=2653157 RepID=UPI0012F1FB91|nr:hypothetical protein [Nocardioides sp. AX2bis]VXC43895.1 hypothetical protein NOCARDAX2BIS_590007 [Nocardioides sp. AX2bis]